MKTIESIEKRREEIIEEIKNINSMRKGTINEQYLKVPRKNMEASVRGPYYVLTKKENGKTISIRIGINEVEEIQKETEEYKKYNYLTSEFAAITEELTEMKRTLQNKDIKKKRNAPRRI
ncbi:MAG: DUF6788 family protein [Bacillota bacterium]